MLNARPLSSIVICRSIWVRKFWDIWETRNMKRTHLYFNFSFRDSFAQSLWSKKAVVLFLFLRCSSFSSQAHVGNLRKVSRSLFQWTVVDPRCAALSALPVSKTFVRECFLRYQTNDWSLSDVHWPHKQVTWLHKCLKILDFHQDVTTTEFGQVAWTDPGQRQRPECQSARPPKNLSQPYLLSSTTVSLSPCKMFNVKADSLPDGGSRPRSWFPPGLVSECFSRMHAEWHLGEQELKNTRQKEERHREWEILHWCICCCTITKVQNWRYCGKCRGVGHTRRTGQKRWKKTLPRTWCVEQTFDRFCSFLWRGCRGGLTHRSLRQGRVADVNWISAPPHEGEDPISSALFTRSSSVSSSQRIYASKTHPEDRFRSDEWRI